LKRPAKPAAAPQAAPRRPADRRVLLALTLLAPLALLALAEGALRLAGIGRVEPLFVPVETAPGYLQPNPEVIRRFFPNPAAAASVSIDSTYFPERKPPGSLRLVVMGESSAAGFPYGRFGSPGEFLARRLERSLPGRDVEVITTAMSAVTSYVLLDFVDEILAVRPDAVLIYTGHNEFLGIGGVGSSYVSAGSPALARLTLQLRRLNVYRALETSLSGLLGAAPAPDEGTLMSRVARERSIPLGSPLYRRGLEQFRGNMERILARFAAARVPVYVGTLASNERDQPPFLSLRDPAGPAARFDAALAKSRAALEGGDAAAAEAAAREAVGLDEGAADGWFALGRSLEAIGRHSEARAAYLEAKDRDALRFRATEAVNDTLRELATAHGAVLVDSQRALAAQAANRIIGDDLMLEHLHPNVRGYFILSDAFYARLADALDAPVRIPRETAWQERPATEIDELAGGYRVLLLENDWPFVPQRRPVELPAPRNDIERLALEWFTRRRSWAETMTEALVVYQREGRTEEAARVAVNLAEAFVNQADPQAGAGRLLLRADAPARALPYLKRAVALVPTDVDYGLSLAEAQFKAGDAAASAATLEQLAQLAPEDERPRQWLEVVRNSGP
jgi:tetratricopeptide (TPR) repeat protein